MSAIPPLSGDKQTSGERVVMILAGIEAELRLGPYDDVFRDYVGRRERGGIPTDHVDITKLLCGYRWDDIEIMMRATNAACGWLVETRWPQIEALAEASLAGVKRTVYPQDWQRGFVACPKCKYDRTDGVAARTANEGHARGSRG
jgi:hypothetical protein